MLCFTLSKQKMEKHKFPKMYQQVKPIHKTIHKNKFTINRKAEAAVGSNPGTVELCGVRVLLQQNYKITPNGIELMDRRILFSIIFFSQKSFFSFFSMSIDGRSRFYLNRRKMLLFILHILCYILDSKYMLPI